MDHVRWLSDPTLRSPTLVAAFTGWNDAGEAASAAVEHLAAVWNAEPIAALDPEEYYDFQVNRPKVVREDAQRRIVWPTTRLLVARDTGFASPPRDVVLVEGIELGKDELVLKVDSELRAQAMRDLIESKAVRRGLSLKVFDWGTLEPAGGSLFRQRIGLRKGLPEDVAKRISKLLRDDFPKVKGQIQGDAVRVTSKNKDDLQKVIARLREDADEFPVSLQFTNYR